MLAPAHLRDHIAGADFMSDSKVASSGRTNSLGELAELLEEMNAALVG